MKIALVTLCKNEEFLIPFFLRHYENMVDEIIVWDNASTDRSVELLEAHPKVRVMHYDTGGVLSDRKNMEIKNDAISYSDAEWFVVCDMDEFLHVIDGTDLHEFCARNDREGIKLPIVRGFNMVNETPFEDHGQKLTDFIKEGVGDGMYDKRILWHRDANPEYSPGAHNCHTRGWVKHGENVELYLLHYKFLFREYTNRMCVRTPLSQDNIDQGWGLQGSNLEIVNRAFDDCVARKTKVI